MMSLEIEKLIENLSENLYDDIQNHISLFELIIVLESLSFFQFLFD
jgi:hypothetical protein